MIPQFNLHYIFHHDNQTDLILTWLEKLFFVIYLIMFPHSYFQFPSITYLVLSSNLQKKFKLAVSKCVQV